jgi:hypothetical protein
MHAEHFICPTAAKLKLDERSTWRLGAHSNRRIEERSGAANPVIATTTGRRSMSGVMRTQDGDHRRSLHD